MSMPTLAHAWQLNYALCDVQNECALIAAFRSAHAPGFNMFLGHKAFKWYYMVNIFLKRVSVKHGDFT